MPGASDYPGAPFEPVEQDADEALALADTVQAAILARLPEGILR